MNILISQNLLKKNDDLIDQLQIIENFAEQVKSNKVEIERDVKKEYIKMIENLR